MEGQILGLSRCISILVMFQNRWMRFELDYRSKDIQLELWQVWELKKKKAWWPAGKVWTTWCNFHILSSNFNTGQSWGAAKWEPRNMKKCDAFLFTSAVWILDCHLYWIKHFRKKHDLVKSRYSSAKERLTELIAFCLQDAILLRYP